MIEFYPLEKGDVIRCFTDGVFCVALQENGNVIWGNVLSLKPPAIAWTGKGSLRQATESYAKYRRTIRVGEVAPSVLDKLLPSGLEDISESFHIDTMETRTFKWQDSKWYLLGPNRLLGLKFFEYDKNVVLDTIIIIPREHKGSKKQSLDAMQWVDQYLLPERK
jgi:hypothetical protein